VSNAQIPVVPFASEAPTEVSASERRKRWFEVGLVLFISCGGALLNSLYLLINGPEALPHISSARWTVGFIQEVSALLLLGYVLSRRGLNVTNLGLRWSLGDIGVGLLVAGASFAAYVMGSARSRRPLLDIRIFSYRPRWQDFFRASVRGRDPIYPFESVL
jgi:hypothetical protein